MWGAVKLDRLGTGDPGLLPCWAWAMPLLSFAAIFFFAPQMALLFLNPRRGPDRLYRPVHHHLGCLLLPLALVNILRFSIQGMGFSNLAILKSVMEMFARMGWPPLLVPAIGYTGACFASPAAWVCADLFLIPASLWASPTSAGSMDSPRSAPGAPSCNLLPDPWRLSLPEVHTCIPFRP